MTRMRPLFGLILALVLVMGSVVQALARTEMLGASDLTVCGETGVVQVDVIGHPLTRNHACPHCIAASAVAAMLTAPDLMRPALQAGSDLRPGMQAMVPPAQTFAPSARGPPPVG